MNSSADLVYSEDSNISMESCPFLTDDSTLQMSVKTSAYLFALLVSLLGNILVICYVYRTRARCSVARLFVSNMAAADILVTVFNMPAKIHEIIHGTDAAIAGWVGDAPCKLLSFFQDLSIYCSILTLVAITTDQFFVITTPLKTRITIKAGRVITALIWLGSALSAAPVLHANKVQAVDGDWRECVEAWGPPFHDVNAARNYTVTLFFVLYAAPLLIMAVLYTCIIYKIWNRKSPGSPSETCARAHKRTRHTVLRMFIAVVVTFAVCWLPFHVNSFLLDFDAHFIQCGLSNHLWFLGDFFGHLNSALNPCIYVVFNKNYREGFKDILRSFFSACTKE